MRQGTVKTVLVYLEFIQKSLIPTRKILSPSFEGDFPFIGLAPARDNKKANLAVDLFYTLCRG